MREAGAVGPLVFAADMVEHIGRDDGRGTVLVEDDVQAVGQIVCDELDGLESDAGQRGGIGLRPHRQGRQREGGEQGEEGGAGHESGMRQPGG